MATTIKALAVELGVSEQALRKWCKSHSAPKDEKGRWILDEDTLERIYAHYRPEPAAGPLPDGLVEELRSRVAHLEGEVDYLREQNAQLVAALQAQQALAAQAAAKLPAPRKGIIERIKSLMAPGE